MNAIELQDLQLCYSSGFALGPLDLQLTQGSRTAVIGPSGSGKTSLLRCIAGLLAPEQGEVRIAARGLGMVFQDGGLWPHMTAVEHLQFVAPGMTQAEVRQLLALVQIDHRADARPGQMSGGEGQRLGLARALAQDPEILLLDEPLHSVDTELRRELASLIRRIAADRGLTLLLVTHDRDEALAIAEDIVVLHRGKIVEQGSVGQLLERPQTTFAAALLAGATCVPLRSESAGVAASPFGPVSLSQDSAASMALVLLPGDLSLTTEGGVEARVLGRRWDGQGSWVQVHREGVDLLVPCPMEERLGATVRLQLRGAPRLLPLLAGTGGQR